MILKRIFACALAAAMMMCFAGCSIGLPDEKIDPPATTSGNETENADDAVPYKLPAGAASPYELYTTVIDYLNNGFHNSDLNNIYDMNLYFVFYAKQKRAERNFTSGMKYDEACALVSRLMDIAKSDMPLDADGEFEDDLIDYYQFKVEFPEEIQSQINGNPDDFEDFIENICVLVYLHDRDDGKNPFRTGQTVWEKCSEGEIDIERYRTDDYEDLYANFPQVYEMEIGEYREGNEVHGMGIIYAKIGSRYYFLGFSESIGSSAGG